MRIFVELDVDEATLDGLLRSSRALGVPPAVPTAAVPTVAPTPEPTTGWMRVEEAARYAAVPRSAIYDACERGLLRHAKVAGDKRLRLKREWVDRWVDAGEQ